MPRWKIHKSRTVLPAFITLFLVACFPLVVPAQTIAPATQPEAKRDEFEQALLMLDINQQKLDETALMLKDRQGGLYASAQDLVRWRLKLPPVQPVSFHGAPYYPLAALPGISTQLNEATQTLSMAVKPEAFASTTANAHASNYAPPIRPSPGMFFNYDVFLERSNFAGTTQSGLFEVGAFNSLGTAVTNFTRQSGNGQPSSVRLETTFTLDRPDRVASFRFGDAVSRAAGIWGSSVHFGGVQYATNFATQPGLVTLPMQNFAGQAVLPSTVDVYVNNMLTTQKSVPPGPFSISDLPVVTGQGNVQMVVRDALGREQVITQPFYASTSLLRPGLQDFSFELGAIRENFGISSNDYGRRFGAGTYRRGVTDNLTAEGHMEVQAGGQSTLGFGATALFPSLGTVNGAVAGSRSDAGNGRLWALGFDRQTSMFNFGARTQIASGNFRQLGFAPGIPSTRRLTSANIGVSAGQSGSIGLAYVRQDVSGSDRVALASISYSLSLNRAGYLGASASKTLSGQTSRAFSINWSMPLGDNINASVSHTSSGNGPGQSEIQVQRSLPGAEGYGYRLQAADNGPQQATLLLQNNVGTYTMEAATFEGQSSARVGVSGGVAFLGGAPFFSRRITDSFGLVQLPGMENVRVYVDNQPAGRTDANGNALLPHLRAYDNNPVRVEQLDLSMDAEISSLTMNPVPYYRSGVVVQFPIKRSHGALMRLVSDDGKALPAGTVVEVEGQATPFPVAMEGEVYLTGLARTNRLRAIWQGRHCTLDVPFKDSADPLPNLGTFVCKGELQ